MRIPLLLAATLGIAGLGLGLQPSPSQPTQPAQPVIAGLANPVATPQPAAFHCQVPCGIYGDQLRIRQILEDCDTIEKAMTQIAKEPGNALESQQFVRWVHTKEQHAQAIQDNIAQYWLAQRIKPLPAEFDEAQRTRYFAQLTHLHHITVHAMRCKQGIDTASVNALREAVHALSSVYFSPEDLEHLKGHHK